VPHCDQLQLMKVENRRVSVPLRGRDEGWGWPVFVYQKGAGQEGEFGREVWQKKIPRKEHSGVATLVKASVSNIVQKGVVRPHGGRCEKSLSFEAAPAGIPSGRGPEAMISVSSHRTEPSFQGTCSEHPERGTGSASTGLGGVGGFAA